VALTAIRISEKGRQRLFNNTYYDKYYSNFILTGATYNRIKHKINCRK